MNYPVLEAASNITRPPFCVEQTIDGIETFWVDPSNIIDELSKSKLDGQNGYPILLDVTALDERTRIGPRHSMRRDFTVIYHLLRPSDAGQRRLKVPLSIDHLSLPTASNLWPNANWYEREIWDMFGVEFTGHPNMTRILMPESWVGHPLRKDHYCRATEKPRYTLPDRIALEEQISLRDLPTRRALFDAGDSDPETMVINLGPNHPSLHGVLRLVVKLKGELIVDIIPEIGFHHRGAEKIAERQSWHSFIPYTDRIDYVAGVMNNFPYVMGVERLAGIVVPQRAQIIRIMLAEFFRIISHLVFFGTMVQDVGQLSPVFYAFIDREKALEVIEAICGFRMHPAWFRVGGVAADLPTGWENLVRAFLDYLPKRLNEYEKMVMSNRIFKARTVGIGEVSATEAQDWGITGPCLRATGVDFDYRKAAPYSGYDVLEFDVPVADRSDCYNRVRLRLDEIRESLRIIRQCVNNMPAGPVRAAHPLATPMPRAAMLQDIDSLIPHFLNVSWGAVVPAGEVSVTIEATKGLNTYYLVSDGATVPYRTRIRTPSFAHLQTIPLMSRGTYLADLIAIIGSIDFVMADVDR